jgi:phosphatidylethanolamine-binding protein (PEBP) family uncharacterized protein
MSYLQPAPGNEGTVGAASDMHIPNLTLLVNSHMTRSRALAYLATLIITGTTCLPNPALAMSASFTWCSGTPSFRLGGVPKGTVKLEFLMMDLQAPSYSHGGGTLAYKGQSSIPCDGLSGGGYQGPSPPPGQVHTYRWFIKAFDASGKLLGETTAERKFPQ